MRIGVPREIKDHEYRVALVPSGVRELVRHGHLVLVERDAGLGAGIGDDAYIEAGASIALSATGVFGGSDLIVKVKEPQLPECAMLQPGQVLFTYLHLAADAPQARALMASGATAIAYETVTSPSGSLPLLAPMSEIAGRMSIQVGAACLQKESGGRGILLGGVPGVEPGRVVILGGGVAGTHAAVMAMGLGADVTVVDRSLPRLRELAALYSPRLKTRFATPDDVNSLVTEADLVVGAVLVPGAQAPKLVTRRMLADMHPGAVIVDIAIDQGGCFETSRPTTHADPHFEIDGIVHYCVANMPGAVPRTSTLALTNATLPYLLQLADEGATEACRRNPHLAAGINVQNGRIVHDKVARALEGH